MMPYGLCPASLLWGFANNARVFPWSCPRDEIWQAFEDYGREMWPTLSPLQRASKILLRWNYIMERI